MIVAGPLERANQYHWRRDWWDYAGQSYAEPRMLESRRNQANIDTDMEGKMQDDNHVLNEFEAAKKLGLTVYTLRNWRSMRRGPSYIKMGRRIGYLDSDLENYIASRRIVIKQDWF